MGILITATMINSDTRIIFRFKIFKLIKSITKPLKKYRYIFDFDLL